MKMLATLKLVSYHKWTKWGCDIPSFLDIFISFSFTLHKHPHIPGAYTCIKILEGALSCASYETLMKVYTGKWFKMYLTSK